MALGIGTAGSLRRIWWLYLVAILTELVADNLMLHIGNEYLALPVDRRAGKT